MFKQGQKEWPQGSDIPTDEQTIDVLESFVAGTELFDAFSRYAISFVHSLEGAKAKRLSAALESAFIPDSASGSPPNPSTASQIGIEIPAVKSFFGAAMP